MLACRRRGPPTRHLLMQARRIQAGDWTRHLGHLPVDHCLIARARYVHLENTLVLILIAFIQPLRPFTILPAGTHRTREEVAAGVFRPDHRLPTMTIDEYLAEEQERGNIITGGGPASLEQPTTSEQLGMDAEQDGTLFGDEKTEAKRQKDENWARYTDVHRKGEGNTMNRG